MAKCGIEKYDELPGRVGWKDVDAMRAALNSLNRGLILNRVGSFFLGGLFSGWPLITVEQHRQYIKDELDEAVNQYEEVEEKKSVVWETVESIEDTIEDLFGEDAYERPDMRVDGEPVFDDDT